MFYYFIFALYYMFSINELAFTITFVIILSALKYKYFVSFGTHSFGDRTLQLPVYLSILITNG